MYWEKNLMNFAVQADTTNCRHVFMVNKNQPSDENTICHTKLDVTLLDNWSDHFTKRENKHLYERR